MTYGGISGENFSLDPNTGVLTTLRALDREEQEEINLTGIVKIPKATDVVNMRRKSKVLYSRSFHLLWHILYFWAFNS